MEGSKIAPLDGFRIAIADLPRLFSEFLECITISEIDIAIQRRLQSKKHVPLIDLQWMGERFVVGLKELLDKTLGRSSGEELGKFWDFPFFAKYYPLAYQQADHAAQKVLAGKLRGGLKPKHDLREFFYELIVGFAYASYGNTVTIVDPNKILTRTTFS
jgi:hypothetical protein